MGKLDTLLYTLAVLNLTDMGSTAVHKKSLLTPQYNEPCGHGELNAAQMTSGYEMVKY